jgi:hypothetical protein
MAVNVEKIWGADICRDGGSYSLCFDSDDGQWYEFFLRISLADGSYDSPAIYRGSADDGHVVDRMSWVDADAFLRCLRYDGSRFQEIVDLVAREARRD